jgi:hypothetical protein
MFPTEKIGPEAIVTETIFIRNVEYRFVLRNALGLHLGSGLSEMFGRIFPCIR